MNLIFAQFENLPLLPLPASLNYSGQSVKLNSKSIVISNSSIKNDANFLSEQLYNLYGKKLKIEISATQIPGQINFISDPNSKADFYSLTSDSAGVTITGDKTNGLFYGMITLLQLLPPDSASGLYIPVVKILDSPEFSYRGMHLDVARHFFSVEVVKQFLDRMAFYKMNNFHWHLTDDQGWRIEVKRHPRLHEIGGYRNGTLIGHFHDAPPQFDSIHYGGYYSQEEIKEVVAYASKLHINVIPEIDMPGHMMAAIAAYPELACNPSEKFETGKTWGVYKDVLCPNENTFAFMKDVLDEIIPLFPSPYIHIGGDECAKDRWKNCDRCQLLMKQQGLKNEEELQYYFTNRIATHLRSKGKKVIGWDEILSPSLDSSAIVMSYRGYKTGVEASLKGHDVIMTPEGACYFDLYQSGSANEALSIGGYLPVDQVYSYNPVPDVLTSAEAKHILGSQGNVWTEYISTADRIEEMTLPRMPALAEVLWTPSSVKNYEKFSGRLLTHFKMMSFRKWNYSKAIFEIQSRIYPNGSNGVKIELFTPFKDAEIRYTIDGTEPSYYSRLYSGKIIADQTKNIKAAVFISGRQTGNVISKRVKINKATGKEIILKQPPHPAYNSGGAFSLVNGLTGRIPWIPSEWLGFQSDMIATIDFESEQTLSSATLDVLTDSAGFIFAPRLVMVELSNDNQSFTSVAVLEKEKIITLGRQLTLKFNPQNARWMRITATHNGKINYEGSEKESWIFIDEIGAE